jgi:hypothetical protein
MNRNWTSYILAFLICSLLTAEASAFRPIAHIILQKRIAQSLPASNIFRIAMEKYPVYAAWGAVGPDLAYIPITKKGTKGRKTANLLNQADIWHYYRTASFCKNLLESSIASGDTSLMAFAAGWLTHVAADFGGHGKYVFPSAGYYIETPGTRRKHGKLEQRAESILFVEEGKEIKTDSDFYSAEEFEARAIFEKFFQLPYKRKNRFKRLDIINDRYKNINIFLKQVINRTYGPQITIPVPNMMANYDLAFGSLFLLRRFHLINYKKAKRQLSAGQEDELQSAFQYATTYGTGLLQDYFTGKDLFTNKWNLDVGPDAPTLVMKTVIHKKPFSGSFNKLMMEIKDDQGEVHKTALSFKSLGLMNFRYHTGDTLYGYFYLNPAHFTPGKEYAFTVKKKAFLFFLRDKSVITSLTIDGAGAQIFKTNADITLNMRRWRSGEFRFRY